MKIGFDARLIDQTGVGRYIQNILPELIKKSPASTVWVVFVRKKEEKLLKSILPKNRNIKVVRFNFRWHGFLEQILLPFYLYKNRLNIHHTPYINVPVLYFKRKAVTIHDLTVLTEKTGRASTRNFLYYKIKYFGYKIALKSALKSNTIFTVSASVKEDIISLFPKINHDKIVIAYNGFTKLPKSYSKSYKINLQKNKPYFLYVGNAHPHKNLEFLLEGLQTFFEKFPKYKIIIAGKNDFFMKRLYNYCELNGYNKNIIWEYSPSDRKLNLLYSQSTAVILPSKKEGFGLQLLEAMQCKTLILCSRIPAYIEVAGKSAFYFDPFSKRSFLLNLAKLLKLATVEKERVIADYPNHLNQYSWATSAKKILNTYFGKTSKSKKLVSRV